MFVDQNVGFIEFPAHVAGLQAHFLGYISGPVYGFWRTYHQPEFAVQFRIPDHLLQIHNSEQVFVGERGIGPTTLLDFLWFGGTCKLHTGG